MKDTKIEWADDTVNAWWGCERVSPACTNCYAADVAARFHPDEKLWGSGSTRRLRVDRAIGELESIARRSERDGFLHRVFLMSMGDIFEGLADLVEPRKRLWDALHRLDGKLIPMVLTKRPELMAAWAKEHGWPAGAWAGTTVEDQRRADERIPALLRMPAVVRFLSCEPLLGPVELPGGASIDGDADDSIPGIHWIIVGGESGPKARPMHPAWARSLRDQSQRAGVPFFFKQWGEWEPGEGRLIPTFGGKFRQWRDGQTVWRVGKKEAGRLLDGRTWDDVPTT